MKIPALAGTPEPVKIGLRIGFCKRKLYVTQIEIIALV